MRLTLLVVATRDGFIARHPGHAPQDWASAAEQAVFLDAVAAADWGIMGRGTHLAADRPDRRRIVFSRAAGAGQWRRPTQLWLDPTGLAPRDLADRVAERHPLRRGLILGGTAVHDWFDAAGAIDRVRLTVEPLCFGTGLPIFSDQPPGDPRDILAQRGYRLEGEEVLNATGTVLLTYAAPRG